MISKCPACGVEGELIHIFENIPGDYKGGLKIFRCVNKYGCRVIEFVDVLMEVDEDG